MLFEPPDTPRVEGFDAEKSLIGIQEKADFAAKKLRIIPGLGLQLNNQRHLPVHHFQEILKGRDPLPRAKDLQILDLPVIQRLQPSLPAAAPLQIMIVMQNEDVVVRQMHVGLDAVAFADRPLEGEHRIFRRVAAVVKQPAVRDVLPGKCQHPSFAGVVGLQKKSEESVQQQRPGKDSKDNKHNRPPD